LSKKKERVIKISARRFEFSPAEIKIRKGEPVIPEFTSLDVHHGFNCPGLAVRTDIYPDKASTVRIVPEKSGVYNFFCDVFCGEGHSDMSGKITVEE